MVNGMKRLFLADIISPRLFLRDTAARLFSDINKVSDNRVILDFTSVESISRSFAHEYLLRKKQSKKEITEDHLPINVVKMFDAIINSGNKQKVINQNVRFELLEA